MKKRIALIVISVVMAVLSAALTPLQIFAAAGNPVYISELFIVTADKLGDYRKDGYKIYDTPLYTNTYNSGVNTSTYLVAKTTTEPSEAITDIKALRMNGGFSFKEYNDYLRQLTAAAETSAINMWPAVEEFKTNYKNGSIEAKTAYQILNCFLYDDTERPDVVDNNGNYMKLGDLFVSDKITKDILKTLMLEANSDVGSIIYTALALACSRDADKETFLDKLSSGEIADAIFYERAYDPADYHDVAVGLLNGIDEFREAIEVYNARLDEYNAAPDKDAFIESLADEDFYYGSLEELENQINANNGIGNTCELFCKGKKYTELLSELTFEGYNVCADVEEEDWTVPMCDFLMIDENLTNCIGTEYEPLSKENMIYELEYFVCAMTPGLRALSGMGITQLIATVLSDPQEYIDTINELKQDDDPEVVEEMKNGVSVFYGVDRDIFKEGMVAMTSKAISANATGDSLWAQKQEEMTANAARYEAAARIALIASGATAFGTLAAYTALSAYVGASGLKLTNGVAVTFARAFFGETILGEGGKLVIKAGGTLKMGPQVTIRTSKTVWQTRSIASIAAGRILGTMFVISVIALIVSVVLYFVNNKEDKVYSNTYEEIPAIICDHRTANDTSKYIYYYGVTNPYLSTTESVYPRYRE